MKKERFIYIGLTICILALFSFELVLKKHSMEVEMISLSPDEIHSISLDISTNVYFTAGDENKVLLEGQSELLKYVRLHEKNGHLSLKIDDNTSLYNQVKTYLQSKETFNLYITSSYIKDIEVTNNKGAVHNALFNEDRGILHVKNKGLAQLIRSLNNNESYEETVLCTENKSINAITCL